MFKVAAAYVGKAMKYEDILIFALKFCVIFFSSCLIGFFMGLVGALAFKHLTCLRDHKLASQMIFITFAYIPFFIAGSVYITLMTMMCSETLQLSGIVTILFTGIACRRYCAKNMSADV